MSVFGDLVEIAAGIYGASRNGGSGVSVQQGATTNVAVDVTPNVLVGVEAPAPDLAPIGDAIAFVGRTQQQIAEANQVQIDRLHDDYLSTLTGIATQVADQGAATTTAIAEASDAERKQLMIGAMILAGVVLLKK
jgi:hypothetical protein